tara:strand:- start:262 stop:1356 length:1095 start_codon:yes stop_codon:yes gene_type:complete
MAAVRVGVAVTITGLAKRPDLNGQRGYINQPQHQASGRWPVQLAAEQVLVRGANLSAEPPADALIEKVLTDPDCVLSILSGLDTAGQLANAAAVARLWREQAQVESLWEQLFERHFAPAVTASQRQPSAQQRTRCYVGPETSPARKALRCRVQQPPATGEAIMWNSNNVRKLSDGTFVSVADSRMFDSQPILRAEEGKCIYPLVGTIGYFEASGLTGSSIGLARGPATMPNRSGHIGWHPVSYALHSDDGHKWRRDRSYQCGEQGDPFLQGGYGGNGPATVGVGLDFADGSLFFTVNGKFVGVAFEISVELRSHAPLFPALALHEKGDRARFNLGHERFAFDLEAHWVATQAARAEKAQQGPSR